MKPNQRATVYTLLERGSTQREIARITGIDRKTVRNYQRRWEAEQSNSPGVATGSGTVAGQIPPPWPPAAPPASLPVATSLCEPHRQFIEAQLRLKRNATAIYQDLVDLHGFAGQYNSVKRFVAKLRQKDERVFNPSRETRQILRQAAEIGEHAARLCQLLFAIEGRVGQRKLWGIVNLNRRYPAHCVNAACAQALEQGIYSYKRVLALTERLFAQAVGAMDAAGEPGSGQSTAALTQQHALIRDADEYGDLFAHAAAATIAATTTAAASTQRSRA